MSIGVTKNIKIARFEQNLLTDFEDLVLAEKTFSLFLNGISFAKFICTEKDIKELAAGHLYCEGCVKFKDELLSVLIDSETGAIYAETVKSADCSNDTVNNNPVKLDYGAVVSALKEFQEMSPLFKETGCVHSAALLDEQYNFHYFSEDIGRYNAVEKAIGKAFLDGFSLNKAILVASSRMPLELIQIIYRAGIHAVVSISAPTLQSIYFAREHKIILAGMFRGSRINIYAY